MNKLPIFQKQQVHKMYFKICREEERWKYSTYKNIRVQQDLHPF